MAEPLRLSAFVTAANRLYRRLFLSGETEFSVGETERGIPLFLGCDVLAGSRVSTNHHSRTHVRFAARGAACKLFLGVKLEGINSTDALWFYTVRGVFQVAFELHEYAVQDDVVRSMRDIWDKHGSYSPATAELHLSWAAVAAPSADKPEVACSEKQQLQLLLLHKPRQPHRQPSPTEAPAAAAAAVPTPVQQLLLQASASLATHEAAATASPTASPGSPAEPLFLGRVQMLLRCCAAAAAAARAGGEPGQIDRATAAAWLEHALSVWHKMADDDGKLRRGWLRPQQLRPCPPLTSLQLVVLTAACEAVGDELAGLQQAVADRAEQFKKAHLHSIDSLPPARTLVAELFPECMVRLLAAWMRGGGAAGSDGSEPRHGAPQRTAVAGSDDGCCRVEGSNDSTSAATATSAATSSVVSVQQQQPARCHVAPREARRSAGGEPLPKQQKQSAPESECLYPFVQLILEFATNCPVSGVAHVLYSRLLHSVT